MGKFRITGPDGQTYDVTAPDDASEADVLSYVQRNAGMMANPGIVDPMTGPAYKEPPPKGSLSDTVFHGFTGGLTDEVGGVGRATGRMLAEWQKGKPFMDALTNWPEYYNEGVGKERAGLKAYAKENPVTAFTSEVAGGIASPLFRALAPFSRGAQPGASVTNRAVRAAADGGLMGGFYGAANAEGGPVERGAGAGVGAGIGAVTGGVSVPVVDAVAAGARKIIQPILDRYGNTQAGQRKAVEAIAKGNGGDVRAALQTVQKALAQGDDLAIADVGGINAQRMTRAVANVPGQSSQIADDFVAQRAAGRGGRMQSAADKLSPNRFYDSIDDLNMAQRQSSKLLYDEAFAPVSDKAGRVYAQWDDRLQSFLDDPIVKQGMGKGIRIQQLEALAEGRPFNFQEFAVKGLDDQSKPIIAGTPNLRAMDAAKRGLDEILEGYRDKTTGKVVLDEYGRAVDKVRRALVDKLDDITTVDGRSAYKEARAAWAGPAKLKDAQYMGRNFLRGDEEVTRRTFEKMTPGEQEAFQLGVRREISGMINTDTQAAPGKFAEKKADLWGRLRSVFPEDRFNAFKADIDQELMRMRTEKFVGPRTGPHTTPMKEDIAELSRMPSWALESLEGLKNGSGIFGRTMGALSPVVRGAGQAMSRPDEKVATQMAEIFLTMDKAKQAEFLNNAMTRRYAEDFLPVLTEPYRARIAEMLGRGGALAGAR